MRLYVNCKECRNKIILPLNVSSRGALRRRIGGAHFHLRCNHCHAGNTYNISAVNAECNGNSLKTGTIVGGIIGLIGGPIGAMIGGGLGAAIGVTNDADEQRKVNYFNQSF